jgi:hypothetical protein
MPLIATLDISRLTPWAGWEIELKPGTWTLGPLQIGGHDIKLAAGDGWVSLHRDGVEIAATDMPGTLWRVAIAEDALSCLSTGGGRVRIPSASIDRMIEASYDGKALPCNAVPAGGTECVVPSRKGCADLVLRWRK